jgi:hypothetical protein
MSGAPARLLSTRWAQPVYPQQGYDLQSLEIQLAAGGITQAQDAVGEMSLSPTALALPKQREAGEVPAAQADEWLGAVADVLTCVSRSISSGAHY